MGKVGLVFVCALLFKRSLVLKHLKVKSNVWSVHAASSVFTEDTKCGSKKGFSY